MDDLKAKYLDQIANARTKQRSKTSACRRWQKGRSRAENARLGKMTPEERQTAGPALNALKDEINSALRGQESRPG